MNNTAGAGGNMTQQTINIQNLYQMYQANPHSANDKYAALDHIQIPGQQPKQPQMQQQMPFQPMVPNMGMQAQ